MPNSPIYRVFGGAMLTKRRGLIMRKGLSTFCCGGNNESFYRRLTIEGHIVPYHIRVF